MHHFTYKNLILHAENVDLEKLSEQIGTPFYCYSTATIQRHYEVLSQAFAGIDHLICFAVKANSNLSVLATLAQLGAGMDVVSYGELLRAQKAGVEPKNIIFSGVGKSKEEMLYALQIGILGFNVESEPELELLNQTAQSLGKKASISIRVNPDIDAKTHAKISTGKSENKFGVSYLEAPRLYEKAREMQGISISGIHMHIGSQITELEPFSDAFTLMRELVLHLLSRGIMLKYLDIGGGLGVPYRADIEIPPNPFDYARLIKEKLGNLGLKIVLEPGRMIVGNAGILVTKVLYVKHSQGRYFTIVDAGMNDLIRPTLYDAYHDIWPLIKKEAKQDLFQQDIVGPICETGDYLALDRLLPIFSTGDLIAIMTAGAYGAVMSSYYNSRLLTPEILVKGDKFAIVRPRQTYDDIIGFDRLPSWVS
ncbi:MAG: diaminopimelate decarboxylase [Hyphomicrobium sp.]